MQPQPPAPTGPRALRAGGGAGSRAGRGESQGVTGAAAAAAPAPRSAPGMRFSFSPGFFGGGRRRLAPTGPMPAVVVRRLATSGANGRRPSRRRGGAGAGWEPGEPAEAGTRPRGAERGRRGPGRREPEAEAGPPRAARLCGPSGLRGPDEGAERSLPAAPGDVTVRA